MNWAIVIPRGDWVDTYPTTNGRIIQGIRLAALFVWFVLAIILVILLVAFFGPSEKIKLVPWDVIDGFLQLLGWFIVGMMGVAAAQFGLKRATTNPETVKAVSDAKVMEMTTEHAIATTTPQPVGVPHPPTDPAIVEALATVAEKQRSEEALLTQEAEARRQKHALAPPNGLEE